MMNIVLSILFGFVVVITPTFSARILGIVSTPSFSHQIVFRPLWRELSLRGHNLTVLTTDPMRDTTLTNLTEIDMGILYKKWQDSNLNEMSDLRFLEMMEKFITLNYDLTEEQLLLPEIQELLKSETAHFDLLIIEPFCAAMMAFAERFDCPLIQMFSLDAPTFNYHTFGNPSNPVLNPDFMLPFSEKLNFFERLLSSLYVVWVKYLSNYRVGPIQQALIEKHFGSDYPPFSEISKRTSLMFVNTDTVFHPLRPLLPSVIQIGGGTHLTPIKPLPK
ncbi:hypothetical protein ILUMI_19283, partial [Ignelater luminosus]